MIIIICLRDDVLTHWVADNTLANFQIDNDRTNCVRISFSRGESHIANTQREEECCSTIAHVVTALTQKLPFLHLTVRFSVVFELFVKTNSLLTMCIKSFQ